MFGWPVVGGTHGRLRTAPPSWSVEISAFPPAARCSRRVIAFVAAALGALSLKRMTPAARPAFSARPTYSGSGEPAKRMITTAPASLYSDSLRAASRSGSGGGAGADGLVAVGLVCAVLESLLSGGSPAPTATPVTRATAAAAIRAARRWFTALSLHNRVDGRPRRAHLRVHRPRLPVGVQRRAVPAAAELAVRRARRVAGRHGRPGRLSPALPRH